jgi:hypothetical protein
MALSSRFMQFRRVASIRTLRILGKHKTANLNIAIDLQ